MTARRLARLGVVALMSVAFFTLASSADAAHFQRPFKEVFGSAEQPTFSGAVAVAVDRKTGDVYVAENGTQSITRYKADGTPDPFEELGTNVIDGAEANGKPCSEEPASCDKTPQNGIEVSFRAEQVQVAVDESEGATAGDIYINEPNTEVVSIFGPDGKYLGQLTAAGIIAYNGGPYGVAVDPAGTVYVPADIRLPNGSPVHYIYKYAPTGPAPVNSDIAGKFEMPEAHNARTIALGSGPTEGSLFVSASDGVGGTEAYEFNVQTGEVMYRFAVNQVGLGTIAVDPQSGTVLMTGRGNSSEVQEYEAPAGSEPVRISRLIANESTEGFAVDGASQVLVGEFGGRLGVYGKPGVVPTVAAEPAVEVIGTKATLSGIVEPTGLPVESCVFEYGETAQYGQTAPCEGEIGEDSGSYPVTADLTGLEPNGHTYHFKLVATNANGTEESGDQTLTTIDTTVTKAATGVESNAATLNGTVRPEGAPYSECFFRYGPSTSAKFEKTVPCEPPAGAIAPDFLAHPVSVAIEGLKVGTTYRFQVVAKNSFGVVEGDEFTFTTHGAPRITEIRARDAGQSAATLEGKINPSGYGTTYRFEWGPTSSYGNVVPIEFEPFVGSGEAPVQVSVKAGGLSAGSTYHYRIVAKSEGGTTASPDQTFETLNLCGLWEGRCDELVSRRDSGPIAIPGEAAASAELHYQAATAGPGGLAYVVEAGYPEATKGAEVLYRGLRGPTEWTSSQLSAAITAPNEQQDAQSGNGPVGWLSNDLSCGIQQSFQPLTPNDPAMEVAREYGGSNLYRINPDGTRTGVTTLPPENPESAFGTSNFNMIGGSQNCGKFVFETLYTYPGVPAPFGEHVYEWDEGELRSVGVIPAPGGEEVVVSAKAGSFGANGQNAVSEDGSRVFFSAFRQTSPNEAEIGKQAVFVRENGTTTRDLSRSETSTPSEEAEYQWATPDGSKVFFIANAGLTAESNTEGRDLYEYNLETNKLTDLSVDAESGRAAVGGFVAGSRDGSHVYFVAREQLLPGRGNTYAQNMAREQFSIYGVTTPAGKPTFTYVGKVSQDKLSRTVIADPRVWSSEATADGRYLLFESSLPNTGYKNPTEAQMAYLYDSAGGSEGTICVSCRQDGEPSVNPQNDPQISEYTPLPTNEAINNYIHQARFLTEREGKAMVFFMSADVLAPGAVEDQNNVYAWSHGQVFRLGGAMPGQQSPAPAVGPFALFVGASDDGSDVYFTTPETLSWEDGDQRISVYDARIGGGYPKPPEAAGACQASAENSCQAPAQGAAVPPGPPTGADSGAQNFEPKPKSTPKKKAKPKKKHKKGHKKKGKSSKKKAKRPNNGNRRAGK